MVWDLCISTTFCCSVWFPFFYIANKDLEIKEVGWPDILRNGRWCPKQELGLCISGTVCLFVSCFMWGNEGPCSAQDGREPCALCLNHVTCYFSFACYGWHLPTWQCWFNLDQPHDVIICLYEVHVHSQHICKHVVAHGFDIWPCILWEAMNLWSFCVCLDIEVSYPNLVVVMYASVSKFFTYIGPSINRTFVEYELLCLYSTN